MKQLEKFYHLSTKPHTILHCWFKQYLFEFFLHINLYNTQQKNYNRIEKKAISNLCKVSLLDFVLGLYYADTNANKSK